MNKCNHIFQYDLIFNFNCFSLDLEGASRRFPHGFNCDRFYNKQKKIHLLRSLTLFLISFYRVNINLFTLRKYRVLSHIQCYVQYGNILYSSVLYWKPVLDSTPAASRPIRVFNKIQTRTIFFHIVHNTV
jgi:hypothetical protein